MAGTWERLLKLGAIDFVDSTLKLRWVFKSEVANNLPCVCRA